MEKHVYAQTPGITINNFNQKTYNPSSRMNPGLAKNKFSNDFNINKDSYTYLHTKKINNNNYKKNNYQSAIDFSEPEPQIFQGINQIPFNINYKNNSFDLNSNRKKNLSNNNLIEKKLGNNKNINSNATNRNNKKLLEEYFQLKKENKNNYNTLTNMNNNKNNKIETEYHPLIKKNKTKKTLTKKKNINFKKSNSFKNDILSQIYQPENNITNSPSFTPIKSKLPNQKNSLENTPNFNSKSSSNTNINSINKNKPTNNFTQRKKCNNNKIINNDVIDKNSKKIKHKESKNKKFKNKEATKTPTTRKNLTPTKIPGIWVESNILNYNKTYSIDKNENNNINKTNNYNITSTSYIHSNNNNNNISNNNSNISSINSTELYWKRKEKEKEKKLEKLRTERLLKEEKELQDRPKINNNSKKIIDRKCKNLDVFDRLSDINQLKNHRQELEKIRDQFKESHTPYINDNSRRMKRTIDDLYNWKNVNERKKTESANNFNKLMNKKQIKINPLSEEILREKKSEYLNKKVEDRLLEQGRKQKYKNEIERQKYLQNMTMAKKYTNNEYINVHSRYLESPHSSHDRLNEKNYKSCDRIIKRGNKNDYKTVPMNNNNNSFVFKEGNNVHSQGQLNNYKNNNMNEKEVFLNNNGNNLINGNINNYINNNNNLGFKIQKNNLLGNNQNINQNSDNILDNNNNKNVKNNHYQYFPNYKSSFNEKNNNISNNYKIIKNKDNYNINKNNFRTENNNFNKNVLIEQYNTNIFRNNIPLNYISKNNSFNKNEDKFNNILYQNNNNMNPNNNIQKSGQDDIINIRKHLNEFYENKKKLNVINLNDYSNNVQKPIIKDESIKNDLLK